MTTQLNNLAFFVNGDQVAYEADSLSFTDGFGEYSIRNAVVGGSQTEQIFSEDIKTKNSMVKVSLPTTVANLGLVRQWKSRLNDNVIEINGTVDGQTVSRIFTQAAILADPETGLATEGSIELDWKSNPRSNAS